MSQIIINEKNFIRFSNRLIDLLSEITNNQVSLGKLQSQEIFSKVLGVENVHELRTNLKKQKIVPDYTHKITKNKVDSFFNKKLSIEEEQLFIKKLKLRMDYVIKRIADISGYDLVEWNFGVIPSPDGPSILNCLSFLYFPDSDRFKNDMKHNLSYSFEYLNTKIICYEKYAKSFPTNWLYEDFEITLTEEVKTYTSEELKKPSVITLFQNKLRK